MGWTLGEAISPEEKSGVAPRLIKLNRREISSEVRTGLEPSAFP